MLPPEITFLVAEELDLESLIALSQACTKWRSAISDRVFQAAIKRTCPWFEPRFSKRTSWKECVIEQIRRSKPGVNIIPKLKPVGSDAFQDLPVLDTTFERLDKAKISNLVYTSDHGISVDLSNTCAQDMMKERDQQGLDYGHYWEDGYDSKVISLPHMLVVIAVYDPEERPEGNLVIKFRDSPGVQPDLFEGCFEMPSLLIFGDHVFLVMPSIVFGWALFYLVDRQFEIVAEVEGFIESISYFDGLVHYFRGGTHHALQPSLGKEPVIGNSNTGSILDLLFLGKRSDIWDFRYSVVPTHTGEFIVDVAREIMVRASKDGGVYTVQKSITKSDR
ncbi:hypothetical protein CJU89_4863 [Yarrowia sp. B02]|nr:hypothetical protein CJU89_4863 [Yarrowia sp. B02]